MLQFINVEKEYKTPFYKYSKYETYDKSKWESWEFRENRNKIIDIDYKEDPSYKCLPWAVRVGYFREKDSLNPVFIAAGEGNTRHETFINLRKNIQFCQNILNSFRK